MEDWTVKDGCSNSSEEFNQIVGAVANLLREGGASVALRQDWINGKARLIVAQLAHVYGMVPVDRCTCAITHSTDADGVPLTTIDPANCTYSGHMDPAEAFDR